ncbi:hypothetical protein Bcav_2892 [Beutenbergia cavernae DSM 12333]|uniref:UBA/THIF-type NAD/FAD binding protein n=1 Tax=Beutenbergia cavernae (strain ATCC BAA-8 / DSM 12333 / CCUG 43141 / JCM 11478 / NBRC 16432 / NCIMB 13614 / HKI 0122) TaxID=471853 RepID=C5BZ22_BEUC1|nr:hypothetical protein Bcav_2892 [Beutenbergia cavernae DSM 12333]
MRLRSGIRVLWREDGVTQFGTDARRAFSLRGLTRGEQALCERLVRPIEHGADLRRAARANGVGADRASALVETLLRAGVVVEADDAPDLPDGSFWERAVGVGSSSGRPVRARSAACVAVLGADRLGITIGSLLAGAGVGTILLDDDAPVGPADVGPPGYLASDVGVPRGVAGVGALRRAQPGVRVSARGDARPDVAVLVSSGVAHPWRAAALMREDVTHVSVLSRELDVVVGPFVEPGRTACLRCVDLHRTDRDARWPVVATQLAGDDPVEPESVTLHLAASLLVRDVLAELDGRVPATVATTIEVDPFTPFGRIRTWETHPRCGCSEGAFRSVIQRPSGRGGRRHLGLARTAAAALARDDDAVHEHLAAPDAPRLAPADGAREALDAERAVGAQGLGPLDVVTALGEPEVTDVGLLAGQGGGADQVSRRGDGRDRRPGR